MKREDLVTCSLHQNLLYRLIRVNQEIAKFQNVFHNSITIFKLSFKIVLFSLDVFFFQLVLLQVLYCSLSLQTKYSSFTYYVLGGSDRSSGPRGSDGDREAYRRGGSGASDKGGTEADFDPLLVSFAFCSSKFKNIFFKSFSQINSFPTQKKRNITFFRKNFRNHISN